MFRTFMVHMASPVVCVGATEVATCSPCRHSRKSGNDDQKRVARGIPDARGFATSVAPTIAAGGPRVGDGGTRPRSRILSRSPPPWSAVNDLLAALVLGIIEGITEFLPISSTGHLLIAQHWLGARSDLFNIAIQAGAILAIALIYRQRLWDLAMGLLGRRAPAAHD